MNRISEAEMLEFCSQQRESFDATLWIASRILPPDEIATVALFLASVYWFGYRDELLKIADHMHPGCVGHFPTLARNTHFDCGRFSTMLRRKLDHAQTAA